MEAELAFELLMGLLTNPPGLNCGSKRIERGICGHVGNVVFTLSGRPALADSPDFITGQSEDALIENAVFVAIGDVDAPGRKVACERPLGAAPPAQFPPSLAAGQHLTG